jgi:glutamyl-tRNA(Gln) amidotransferase subunit D
MVTQIKLEFEGETLEGVLIKEDDNFFIIKLASGYNANLKKKDCRNIVQEEIKNLKKESKFKTIKDKNLKNISIIHTGGTIASKVDYKVGGVVSDFTPEELLAMYPELNKLANINAKMISSMFSGDMRFAHYNIMLKEIENAISSNCDGIIISHGTDTLAYTSAALQYSLKNLPVPVVIVAAQRSSDRPSSDSYGNLTSAVNFIIHSNNKYNRVCLCMPSSLSFNKHLIFDSISLSKTHSSRIDTFKQINYSPLASIEENKISYLREIENFQGKFTYTLYDEKLKIGIFKSHPNLYSKEIENLSFLDGVVIEGTGLGHLNVHKIDEFTDENVKNLSELEKLQKKTMTVMGTQCQYGDVNLNVYSYGRSIKKTGILGHGMNLSTETLFARIAYCLSVSKNDLKKAKELWNTNLEGFELRSIEINQEDS